MLGRQPVVHAEHRHPGVVRESTALDVVELRYAGDSAAAVNPEQATATGPATGSVEQRLTGHTVGAWGAQPFVFGGWLSPRCGAHRPH